MPIEFYRDRENWGGHVHFVKIDDQPLLDKHGEPERFSFEEIVQMRDHGKTPAEVLAARAQVTAVAAEAAQTRRRGRG